MGNYLAAPNAIKESHNGTLGKVCYGVSSMQGWRVSMEDAHLIHYFDKLEPANTPVALVGIYDGHGGSQVARFVARHLVDVLLKNPDFKKGRFDAACKAAYVSLDVLLSTDESQPELEWFANSSSSSSHAGSSLFREPSGGVGSSVGTGSMLSSHATLPQAVGNDGTSRVTTIKVPSQSLNGTAATHEANCDLQGAAVVQRSGLRTLGEKMFHRRGDKRRKASSELATAAPTRIEKESSTGASKKHSLEKYGEFIDSIASGKEATAASDFFPSSSSNSDLASSSGELQQSPSDTALDPPSYSNPSSTVDESMVLNDVNPSDEEIPDPFKDTPMGQASTGNESTIATSSNLFSLNGIRSLFSGIMKFGSSYRSPQANQGLAMLSGCTAVTVLLTDKQLIVANAGDSRCVLCRGLTAIELSKDHKPQLPEERARIYSAGGYLEMGRVNGNLNLSRALGDLVYKCNSALPAEKQIVSGVPDVLSSDITDEDEFLIVGCDGIWESATSQEIVDFIRERIGDAARLSDVLEVLFEELLSPNPTLVEFGCDNMTAVLIDLQPDRRKRLQAKREVTALSSISGVSSESLSSVSLPTTPAALEQLSAISTSRIRVRAQTRPWEAMRPQSGVSPSSIVEVSNSSSSHISYHSLASTVAPCNDDSSRHSEKQSSSLT